MGLFVDYTALRRHSRPELPRCVYELLYVSAAVVYDNARPNLSQASEDLLGGLAGW